MVLIVRWREFGGMLARRRGGIGREQGFQRGKIAGNDRNFVRETKGKRVTGCLGAGGGENSAGHMGFVTRRWRGMWQEGGCEGLKLRAKFSGQIRGEGKSGVGRVVSSRQGKGWASGSGKGKVNSSREGGSLEGEFEGGWHGGFEGGEREGVGTGAGGENRGGARGTRRDRGRQQEGSQETRREMARKRWKW